MVGDDIRFRLRAVKQYVEGSARTADLCRVFGISPRTLREWSRRYREEGVAGLLYRSRRPDRSPRRTPTRIEDRILRMKRRHPTWGGKRIHAYLRRAGVTVSWRTVHRVLKRNGLMIRIRREPKLYRRFQRHHVASSKNWRKTPSPWFYDRGQVGRN